MTLILRELGLGNLVQLIPQVYDIQAGDAPDPKPSRVGHES